MTGAALSLFQLWQAVFGTLGATWMRPIHLTWILALGFLASAAGSSRRARAADLLLAGLSVAAGIMVIRFDRQGIDHILYGLDAADLAAGVALIALLLEATRRRPG
ncbi:MAG: transporter, partial [Acidobacteria bacterium]|nr:transporter [Acidobacteriota bacterium]